MNISASKTSLLSDIIEQYDAFFIDIWGVLHDGLNRYEGAREALKALTDSGKTTLLLSNAPRSAELARVKLRELGILDDYYNHIVTSGEVTRRYLTQEQTALRGNYYMLGGSRDGNLLKDAEGFTQVFDDTQADMILLTGYDDSMAEHDEVSPYLKRFRERDLCVVNANPDKRVELMTGEIELCAGTIADDYRAMGGTVIEIGKPHASAYAYAARHAGLTPETTRIACIGDNMNTDIKGACDNGFDGYLVASGMHQRAIKAQGIDVFLSEYTWRPHGILSAFR